MFLQIKQLFRLQLLITELQWELLRPLVDPCVEPRLILALLIY